MRKKQIKENIKYLKELSNTLQESINSIKRIFEKMNKNKEEIKVKILKIFIKIRNELNSREAKLLLELDKKYNNLYLNEKIFKKSEKLPEKIKLLLEKGYKLENEWENNNKKN